MKKTKLISLLLAIAMVVSILPASVFAASDTKVTAADGTVKITDVPIYQKYKYSICQYVILESELTGMANKTISDLTWYYSGADDCTRQLEVYLAITYIEDFPCFLAPYGEIKVFDGEVNISSGGSNSNPNELTLEFQNEFEYTDGSLLVTVVDRTGSNSIAGSFYGVQTAKNTSVIKFSDYIEYNVDDIMSYAGELCPFTPKTTFGIVTSFNVNIDEAITNGTVTTDSEKYDPSSDVNVTIEPDEGYLLETFTITDKSGNAISAEKTGYNTYTFIMPESKVDITASFVEANSFNITVEYGENGTVTAPATAYEGSLVTLEIIPEEGYMLDKLTVMQGETKVPMIGENQFVMPSGDVTVTATFADKETITIELFDSYGDGWSGNEIIAYLWDGETKTLLKDKITIESGSYATFELEASKDADVCFYWRAGDYANECSFKITRGDYVYSATQDMCDKFADGSPVCLSTSDGEGDITELYDMWAIVGLEGAVDDPNDEGIRLNRRNDGIYVLSKELEAGDYEFKLVMNNALEEKYGAESGSLIENGSYDVASESSDKSFKFKLSEKTYVTFAFKPIDLAISLSWVDNSKPGSSTIGIGDEGSMRIPFDPYYYYGATQYVIPAEMLSSLDDKTITDITYYYNTPSDELCSENLIVYLHEIEKDTLETFVDISDATKVFEGSVDMSNASGMQTLTLEFDKDYVYGGKDLVVTIKKDAESYFIDTIFYGINGCGSVVYAGNDDSSYDISDLVGVTDDIKSSNFMPKTTFGYKDTVYEIINFEDGEAIVDIPKPGQYSVVFASYDGGRLDSVDIVPVTVTNETAGRISGIETDIFLGRGDKIMLLSDTESITPLCEEYLTNLIIL